MSLVNNSVHKNFSLNSFFFFSILGLSSNHMAIFVSILWNYYRNVSLKSYFISKLIFTCALNRIFIRALLLYSEYRRGRDRMVVGFTITYAISAYHHWCCEFESRSGRGVQHYVIKFVSDFRQVGGFLWVLRFPPPIKLTAAI